MKQGGSRTTESTARQRLRSGLVVVQVTMSFMLLIGAGLMIRSFLKLQSINAGFDSQNLLTMRLSPNFARYNTPELSRNLSERVLSEIRPIHGAAVVSLATNFPFNPAGIAAGPASVNFQIEGQTLSPGAPAQIVDIAAASVDYFAAVGQPLLGGRLFTEQDDTSSAPIAVISQAMARHRWPDANPIGKRISFNRGATWAEIVGVVGDIHEYGLDRPAVDKVYRPLKQTQFAGNLVIRTTSDPMRIAGEIRSALGRVDPQMAIDRVATIDAFKQESVASPRTTTILLSLFAALAVLISASGIGATLALTVRQRTNELGIRMALGAERSAIVRMVVVQGLRLAFLGTMIGIAGSWALSAVVRAMLFDTSPTDIATFAGVTTIFIMVATVACLIPARQITRIDPLAALRQE